MNSITTCADSVRSSATPGDEPSPTRAYAWTIMSKKSTPVVPGSLQTRMAPLYNLRTAEYEVRYLIMSR